MLKLVHIILFLLKVEDHRIEEQSWLREVFPIPFWWKEAETQQKTKNSAKQAVNLRNYTKRSGFYKWWLI